MATVKSHDENLDPVLFDAYHKSQDPRDRNKIEAVLKKIVDYEKSI